MSTITVNLDEKNATVLTEFHVVCQSGLNRFEGPQQRLFAKRLLEIAQNKMEEEKLSGIPHVRIVSQKGKEKLSMTFAKEVGTDDVTFARILGMKTSQSLLGRPPVETHPGNITGHAFLEAPNLHDGDKVLVEVIQPPTQDHAVT